MWTGQTSTLEWGFEYAKSEKKKKNMAVEYRSRVTFENVRNMRKSMVGNLTYEMSTHLTQCELPALDMN